MIATYTYNSSGQITSIDGPRTDVADVVNLAYYPNEEGQKKEWCQASKMTS